MATLKTEIRSGVYYDSAKLMQLQRSLAGLPGVEDAGVVMGTESNKELLSHIGLDTPEVRAAKPDDLAIVVKAQDEKTALETLAKVVGNQERVEPKILGFARGILVKAGEDVVAKVTEAGFRYPMIVKHHDSYASAGMTRDNRVENAKQLRAQFEKMATQYGSARIEEFIEGREFTCLVSDNPDNLDDPYVYTPVEIIFQEGETFKHWAMKFDPNVDMDLTYVTDPTLLKKLKSLGKKIYLALGGVGYGRADIRMNDQGELFLLEINSNPSVLNMPEEKASADYMMEDDPGGVEGFLQRIFLSAISRREKRVLPPQIIRRRKLEPAVVRK